MPLGVHVCGLWCKSGYMWCFSLSCPLYSIQTKVSIALCRHSKFQYLVLSGRNRTLHGTTRPSRQGDGLRHVCSKLKFDQSTVVLWIQKAVRFLQSETGQLGLFGLVCYLVLTGKISWIFDSFLIFFSVISILPVVGLLVFRWWVSKNVVQVSVIFTLSR